MTSVLSIASEASNVAVLGTRVHAVSLRQKLQGALGRGENVQLDFGGIFVTQSFADELLGAIVLRMGPKVLESLAFAGCSEEVKAILRMVISGRLHDFETLARGGSLRDSGVPACGTG